MKVFILGGGLSGLSAGYKLSKKKYDVTILERGNYLGGLASSHHVPWIGKKHWITKTYHHILHGDETTINLIEEFGLENKLHKKKVKQGFLYKNKIFGFSSLPELLKFPLPLADKIRLAKFILKISKKKDWDDIAGLSAKEWIIKEAGEKNFAIFFEQLIWNKFRQSAEKIAAAWFGTRFAKEPSSFLRKFGWVEGGVQQIIDLLAKNIEKHNGKIRLNIKIKKIHNRETKKIVYIEDNKRKEEEADIIISTIPPEMFLKLVDKIPSELKKKLESIKYLSCVCACIGLKNIPLEFYWTNVLDKNLPFVVIFNHTALYEDSAPSEKCVMYILTYLYAGDEFFKNDEEEIFEIYMKSLDKIFPSYSKNVEWYKIAKFENAEAIFSLGFENLPISTNGIYFAGIYRIYPKIRNMASAIESGFEVVDKIISDYDE